MADQESTTAIELLSEIRDRLYYEPWMAHRDYEDLRVLLERADMLTRSEPVGVPTVQAGDWQQYAKEGEYAQDVIERERKDNDALCTLLAQARRAAPSQPVAGKRDADHYLRKLVDTYFNNNCGENVFNLMSEARALLTTANAGKDAKPTYTTGHCEHNKQPGGCQQHNLHCGWPKCDQKEINHA